MGFTELVLSEPYDSISVTDVLARSGVARSTFYAHFSDKKALLVEAMAPLLNVLVRCAEGSATEREVRDFLEHLWSNQALGRTIFAGSANRHVCNALAAGIEQQLKVGSLRGTQMAYGLLGVLQRWLAGDLAAAEDDVSGWLLDANAWQ